MRSRPVSPVHRLMGPVVLAGVIVAFVRCSASDASSPFATGDVDSGTRDGDGNGDSSIPGDAGVASNLPRVLAVVHAADVFDFRVCFATSNTADGATFDVLDGNPLPEDPQHPMPQANYPGIGRGNGAIVTPDLPTSNRTFVIPFLIDALALTKHAGDDCKKILECSGIACIQSPSERVKLPGLDSADLAGGGTRLLAVRGSGATLAMTVIHVDGAAAGGVGIGGQLAHLAPTLPRLVATYGAADGGVSLGSATFGTAGPAIRTLTRPDDAKGMGQYGSQGIALALAGPEDGGVDAGPTSPFYFSSLAAIQQASDPALPPNELFKPGANYVFVVTGDPTVPKTIDGGANPDYAGRGLHVIAIRSSAPPGDGGAL